jgi:hypothetical protein
MKESFFQNIITWLDFESVVEITGDVTYRMLNNRLH